MMDDSSFDFNVSQLSFVTSTPTKKRRVTRTPAPTAKSPGTQFNVPQSRTKGPIRAVCTYCGKQYRCLRSHKAHLRSHAIQDAAARFPNERDILSKIDEIGSSILERVKNLPCFGARGQLFSECVLCMVQVQSSDEFRNFLSVLLRQFMKTLKHSKFILPSAFVVSVTRQTEHILSNVDLRNELLQQVKVMTSCDNDHVIHCCVGEIIQCFSEEVIKFVSRSVRKENFNKQCDRVTFDEEDRQVIHYIGGSIMSGFLSMSKRYPKNADWNLISNTIQTRILQNSETAPVDDVDMKWTKERDRGGLKYICSACLEFLVCVAEVIENLKNLNDGINYEEVQKGVYESHATVVWDVMVRDSLREQLSLSLMNGVIRSFSQTYGKGLTKKKVNASRDKPTASVNLRHKVAPR